MNTLMRDILSPNQGFNYGSLIFSVAGGLSVNPMLYERGCRISFSPEMVRIENPAAQTWFCRFDGEGHLLEPDGRIYQVDGNAPYIRGRRKGEARFKPHVNLWDIILGRSLSFTDSKERVENGKFEEMLGVWLLKGIGGIPQCYSVLTLGQKRGEALLDLEGQTVPVYLPFFWHIQRGYPGSRVVANPNMVNGRKALILFGEKDRRYIGTLFWSEANRRFYHLDRIDRPEKKGYPVVVDGSHQVAVNDTRFKFSSQSHLGTVATLYFNGESFERATYRADEIPATPITHGDSAKAYALGRRISKRHMDGIAGKLDRPLPVVKCRNGKAWIPFADRKYNIDDEILASLGVSDGDTVTASIEDGFITSVHAGDRVAYTMLVRDPLDGWRIRTSAFGHFRGKHLAALPAIIENVGTYKSNFTREMIAGRRFVIGKAGEGFAPRRISVLIGPDGSVQYLKVAPRCDERDRHLIDAIADRSIEGDAYWRVRGERQTRLRKHVGGVSAAVNHADPVNRMNAVGAFFAESELSLADFVDLLVYLQMEIAGLHWMGSRYRQIADRFEQIALYDDERRREELRILARHPIVERRLSFFADKI